MSEINQHDQVARVIFSTLQAAVVSTGEAGVLDLNVIAHAATNLLEEEGLLPGAESSADALVNLVFNSSDEISWEAARRAVSALEQHGYVAAGVQDVALANRVLGQIAAALGAPVEDLGVGGLYSGDPEMLLKEVLERL